MVIERSLVIVRILSRRVPLEKMARQLEHVVGVTRFGRVWTETVIEFVGWSKAFAITVAAVNIRVMMDHALPEKLSRSFIPRIEGKFITSCESDQFWNLRVCACSPCKRSSRLASGSSTALWWKRRELQIFFVAGASVEFGEHFVHAAMFTTEHALKLFFSERRIIGPISEFDCDAECLCARKIAMSVEQSRGKLVQYTRHPAAVEIR